MTWGRSRHYRNIVFTPKACLLTQDFPPVKSNTDRQTATYYNPFILLRDEQKKGAWLAE